MKMNNLENKPRRLTLKSWATMDDFRRSIEAATKEGNWSAVPDLIFQLVETANDNVDRDSFWIEIAQLYNETLSANQPTKNFPILNTREKSKKLPWEYSGRGWYFWLHVFAINYGWDESYIAEMDIDDAVGLYQEILIDNQLDQEWEWGLSEVAYGYDKVTKKSKFNSLPRPDWMRGITPEKKAVKKIRMPKRMMPQGEVLILDE